MKRAVRCVAAIMVVAVFGAMTSPSRADGDWLAAAERAAALVGEGRYAEGIAQAQSALTITRRQFGAESPEVGFALYVLGAGQHGAGKDADAVTTLREALRLVTAPGAPFTNVVPWTEAILGMALAGLGRGAEAEAQLKSAVADAQRLPAEQRTPRADIAWAYANQLVANKNRADVPAAMAQVRRLYETVYRNENAKLTNLYSLAARADELAGDDRQRKADLEAWLRAATAADGGIGNSTRQALAALVTYSQQRGDNAAVLQYATAKSKIDETDHAALVNDYLTMSGAAMSIGDSHRTIAYALKTIALTSSASTFDERVANSVSRYTLAGAYNSSGDVDRARQTYDENVRLDVANFGEHSEFVALNLASRAILIALLQPEQARADAGRAVADIEAAPTVTFPTSRAFVYGFAAEVYGSMGDSPGAVAFLKKALANTSDAEQSAQLAIVIATIDVLAGKKAAAVGDLATAERMVHALPPGGATDVLEFMLNMQRAEAAIADGRGADALAATDRLIALAPRVGYAASSASEQFVRFARARAEWSSHRTADARADLARTIDAGLEGFAISVLTEPERRRYTHTLALSFDAVESVAAGDPRDRENASLVFNSRLIKKALVARSIAARNAATQSMAVPDVAALSRRIALARGNATWPGVAANSRLANQLAEDERTLTRLLPAVRMPKPTWQDIQARLKDGTVAVDISQFIRQRTPADDGEIWYSAAILHRSGPPVLVLLGPASAIEGAALRSYAAAIGLASFNVSPTDAYAKLWAPIAAELHGETTVYLSTDGVLDVMNPSLMRTPSGSYLLDDYDIRIEGSLADLLRPEPDVARKTATILADPAFGGDPNAPCPSTVASVRDASAPALRRLCGTRVEAALVKDELLKNGFTVDGPFLGLAATKQRLLSASPSTVLHIATHGFFTQPKPSAQGLTLTGAFQEGNDIDPLTRSGLLLANSEQAARAGTYAGDGVLTAYEAVGMQLTGTQLVVLSACDTGIGQVDFYGQGSYNLPKAFIEAGARSVIMSMWSVPDSESAELIAEFYHLWLSEHIDAHAALRKAQIDERKRIRDRSGVDQPRLWGAFVLYDG